MCAVWKYQGNDVAKRCIFRRRLKHFETTLEGAKCLRCSEAGWQSVPSTPTPRTQSLGPTLKLLFKFTCCFGCFLMCILFWPSGKCYLNLLLVPSVLHLSHGFQCSPTLNRQPYEGRLPLTSWWRKLSNMTVGQYSLISLAHHCYD